MRIEIGSTLRPRQGPHDSMGIVGVRRKACSMGDVAIVVIGDAVMHCDDQICGINCRLSMRERSS